MRFSTLDSDSEELIPARGGWPPLSATRSHGNQTRKRRSPTSLLSSKKSQKKNHKHLSLLLEEAGLSSSDDSFDQGYWPNLSAPSRFSVESDNTVFFILLTARLPFSKVAVFRLCFSSTILPLLLLASLQSCSVLFCFCFCFGEFTYFYGVFIAWKRNCSICTNFVNCEMFSFSFHLFFCLFFSPKKLYCSLVPVRFIKVVELIGTIAKRCGPCVCFICLWFFCQSVQLPLHLTRSLALFDKYPFSSPGKRLEKLTED